MLSAPALRKAFSQAARPIAIIGAVGGFIGDIIQPLGNFAVWIAALSLVGAVVALVWLIVLRRRAGEEVWDTLAAGLLVLCVGSFVVFTAWSIIFAVGPERGYLATNVEPIGQLQAQLLGLQKDVTEIKQTTQVTATKVAEQSDVQSVAATAQAKGFADLQAQFATLQQGSIVANPTTPQEWYSNARLYQLKGDTANALKAYEGYFQYNLEFVDPYIEYSDLLKATDGIARAREKMDAYYNAHKDSATLDLVSARLLDRTSERLARFNAIATRAPQFGPVFFELGQEYDRALAAAYTSDLLQKQANAYGTLLKLETDSQGYSRYFIDKSLAETNLANAQKSLDAQTAARNIVGKTDVMITQYNDGMQFVVILTEAGVKKILFDIDKTPPTRETGSQTFGGNTTPNVSIKLPVPVGKHTLYVQYIDANGTPSAVLQRDFTVRQVFANFNQQPTDFSTNTIPGLFIIGYAGAPEDKIFTYKWSIDSDALDGSQLAGALGGIQVKDLKPGEHVLYLQAIDQQGNKSEVEQIPFAVK
ncbi:MAG TPA: hypothetical protein VFD70_28085 [Anaerolineae bacterium]|nr:hypothetical protein [Anaerolineae bacterium]